MLDDPAVDQAAGVKHHAGSQQFDRFAHFGRLGKTVQPRQQGEGIQEALLVCDSPYDEPPG
jgi:hypothetical protein